MKHSHNGKEELCPFHEFENRLESLEYDAAVVDGMDRLIARAAIVRSEIGQLEGFIRSDRSHFDDKTIDHAEEVLAAFRKLDITYRKRYTHEMISKINRS